MDEEEEEEEEDGVLPNLKIGGSRAIGAGGAGRALSADKEEVGACVVVDEEEEGGLLLRSSSSSSLLLSFDFCFFFLSSLLSFFFLSFVRCGASFSSSSSLMVVCWGEEWEVGEGGGVSATIVRCLLFFSLFSLSLSLVSKRGEGREVTEEEGEEGGDGSALSVST